MGFVAEVKRGIMKAYNDLKDFGLEVDIIEVVGDEDVDAEYIRRLDEIADEGYDGIIMLPGNESAIAQRLKQPGYGGKKMCIRDRCRILQKEPLLTECRGRLWTGTMCLPSSKHSQRPLSGRGQGKVRRS